MRALKIKIRRKGEETGPEGQDMTFRAWGISFLGKGLNNLITLLTLLKLYAFIKQ